MKFHQRIEKCLKSNQSNKLKASEIAEWIYNDDPDYIEKKRETTKATKFLVNTKKGMLNALHAMIASQHDLLLKTYPNIKSSGENPRRYYYSEISEDENETTEIGTSSDDQTIKENDLYPILATYLNLAHNLFCKRIQENIGKDEGITKFTGKNANHWLYPDIVAVELLNTEWHTDIKNLHKVYNAQKIKLWSFEVKLIINSTNVRKAFFQAVSNSSWANYGYLVTQKIIDGRGEDTNTLKELKILCNLHGIGLIRLKNDDDDDANLGEILIHAREREIDWGGANRLAAKNKDFRSFIKTIEELLRTKEKYYETLFKNAEFYSSFKSDDD